MMKKLVGKLTSLNWPFPRDNGKPVPVVKKQHPVYPVTHEEALL